MGSAIEKSVQASLAYDHGNEFQLRICFSGNRGQQYALTLDQIDDHIRQGTLPAGVDAEAFREAVAESRQIAQGLSDPFTSDMG